MTKAIVTSVLLHVSIGASIVSGATLHVPSEYSNIQSAISAAAQGDSVLVAPGTYSGCGNRDIDFLGKAVLVRSEGGSDQTVIDCQASDLDPHRAIHFHSGEDSSSILDGFTIQNGYAPGDPGFSASLGGAILCDSSSSPSLFNCILRSNTAANAGGGIACLNGSAPRIVGCNFVGNAAENDLFTPIAGYGGGLRSVLSSPALLRCSFDSNCANLGGAMSFNLSNITIDSCIFRENSAVALIAFEPITAGTGGAIHAFRSVLTFTFSTFTGNRAEAVGGLVYEGGRGGGVAMIYSPALFTNCTFHANTAYQFDETHLGEGGGLYLAESSPTLEQCIISGSLDGEAIFCTDTASHPSVQCSDFFGNSGGDWTGCVAAMLGTDGNFSLEPGFCDVALLDFTLSDDSPCTAVNSSCGVTIGAWGIGCYVSALEDEVDDEISSSARLSNSPNPFNSGTEIRFPLNESQHIHVDIFDILGRKQNTLFSGALGAGNYTFSWQGQSSTGHSLPSGVYICRLRTEHSTVVRKLTLLR